VLPLSEDFISDVMIAAQMDAEDFDTALEDAKQERSDQRRKAFNDSTRIHSI
jgi:hypothetical protein